MRVISFISTVQTGIYNVYTDTIKVPDLMSFNVTFESLFSIRVSIDAKQCIQCNRSQRIEFCN